MEYLSKIDHEAARAIIELYLQARDCILTTSNKVKFPAEFIKKHKLGTRSRPNIEHSFDIVTIENIYIEIDDYGKHSHKNQKINDGIINDYAENYLEPRGCEFYRLQKEEIVNSKGVMQPDAYSYLKEHLF